ncbi:Hsp20/alpha crystallin family protein [Halobiforma nitratireducens]|uniref:Heat shock protein Hsp20 n=1 Tax=Halobiforma nitratireducens JCM 10879 TaxID=1227454 RepID=M0M7Q6_9EURY|nr:Hsp20/alpha crystallin family protein [Halobiforma nitratireducens]EMA41847.1 hypothetical protein C446_06010 [Halobiforma nitratireducens JCM 10879]
MTDDHTSDDGDEPSDDTGADGDPQPDHDGSSEPDTGERDDHWLSSLLSALERLERSGSATGRTRTDRTVLDYHVSVGTGTDLLDESGFDHETVKGRDGGTDGRPSGSGPGSRFWPGDRRDRSQNRNRTPRSGSSSGSSTPSEGYRVTARRQDDELLVTADVAGVDPDDVTVGFDDSTLVVAVSGHEIERCRVPWPDRTAEATINNGVLTVLVEATPDDAGIDDSQNGTGHGPGDEHE